MWIDKEIGISLFKINKSIFNYDKQKDESQIMEITF